MTSNKNFAFDGHAPRVTSALYKRICKNMAQGLVCAMLGFCAIVLPAQASAEQVALRDFFERRQFINMKLSPMRATSLFPTSKATKFDSP